MIEIIIVLLLLLTLGLFVYSQFLQQKTDGGHSTRLTELEKEKDHLIQEKARLEMQLETRIKELTQLQQQLEQEAAEKNEYQGKNKQMFIQMRDLENEQRTTKQRLEEASSKLIAHEEQKERVQRQLEDQLQKAANAQKAFEEERQRLINEEVQKRDSDKLRQHSLWNEFEQGIVSQMKTICDKNEIALRTYSNTDLPESFDGKIKPDFMIEFLNQYIIFDAKTKRADSKTKLLDTLKRAAVTTAKKIKESNNTQDFYHTHFLIVPDLDDSMTTTTLFEQSYTFHVITIAAFEPIVTTLKSVQGLHNIDELDPQERDHLATVLSQLEHFIRNQNAANILIAKKSHETLAGMSLLGNKWQAQIDLKSSQLAPLQLNKSQITNLGKIDNQAQEITNLIKPKAAIPDKAIDDAEQMF